MPPYEKLLEVIVNDQIREYIEDNKLLTHCQAGFRKRNSCESSLQTVLSKWKFAVDRRKIVGVVFLDFKRAFETINRELLILKLQKYGFGPKIINWITDYLNNRTQRTKIYNCESSLKSTRFGVPQGTVLGPNLFILYINDIINSIKKCSVQLFADDTLLYFIGDNESDVVKVINEELEGVHHWLHNNSLKLNVGKTKLMILKGRYSSAPTYTHSGIVIENEVIEQVAEWKYLGVMIDENMTFSNHATYVGNKVAKTVNLLGRISKNLSMWSKSLIYKTIILPHFNFCSSILYMLNNTELSSLQRKQNQALRIILNCNRYTSVKFLLEATSQLSVKQIVHYNTMLIIFKIRNNLYPEHLLNERLFVDDVHNYETRSRGSFYVATAATSSGQNQIFHRGLVEYNNLPKCVKDSDSLSSFKVKCRDFIRKNVL